MKFTLNTNYPSLPRNSYGKQLGSEVEWDARYVSARGRGTAQREGGGGLMSTSELIRQFLKNLIRGRRIPWNRILRSRSQLNPR